MKANNLTIIPPEEMEAYQEGSEIKFKPIKEKITYDDISKELFKNNKTYFIDGFGVIDSYKVESDNDDLFYLEENNCISEKQAQKLLAINKLLNVAKYLNGDWKPDWSNSTCKYYLSVSATDNSITIECATRKYSEMAHFKTWDLAQRAIDILGEETIKLALSTDW